MRGDILALYFYFYLFIIKVNKKKITCELVPPKKIQSIACWLRSCDQSWAINRANHTLHTLKWEYHWISQFFAKLTLVAYRGHVKLRWQNIHDSYLYTELVLQHTSRRWFNWGRSWTWLPYKIFYVETLSFQFSLILLYVLEVCGKRTFI